MFKVKMDQYKQTLRRISSAPIKSADGGFGAPQSVEGDNGSAFPGGIIDGPDWSLGITDVAERMVDRQPRNEFRDLMLTMIYSTLSSLLS